jgi:hypothetical protein
MSLIVVRSIALAALLVAVALFAGGCGETVIDAAKTEATLEQNLRESTGKDVTAVECPSDVEVVAGSTFECVVKLAGGEQETATLKILNDDADIEVSDLEPKQGGRGE